MANEHFSAWQQYLILECWLQKRRKPPCSRMSVQFGARSNPFFVFPLILQLAVNSHTTCVVETVLWQGKQPALTHIIVRSHGCAYAAFSPVPLELSWSWSSRCPVTLACHPPWHLLVVASCYSGRYRQRLRVRNLLRSRRTTWGVSTPSFSSHNLRNAYSSHPYYSCTRKRRGIICFPCPFHSDGNIM